MRERGAVALLCLAQFVDVLGVTIAVVALVASNATERHIGALGQARDATGPSR